MLRIIMICLFFIGTGATEKKFETWSTRILQDEGTVFAKLAKSLERFGFNWDEMSLMSRHGTIKALIVAIANKSQESNVAQGRRKVGQVGRDFMDNLCGHGRISDTEILNDLITLICEYLDGIDPDSNLGRVLTTCLMFDQDGIWQSIDSFVSYLTQILQKNIQCYGSEMVVLSKYEDSRRAMLVTGELNRWGYMASIVSQLSEDQLAGMAEFATLDWVKPFLAMEQNRELTYNEELIQGLNPLIKGLIEFMKAVPQLVKSPIAEICFVSPGNQNGQKYPLTTDHFIAMAGMGMFYYHKGKTCTLKRSLVDKEKNWLKENFGLSIKDGTVEEGEFEVGRSDGILKIKLLT